MSNSVIKFIGTGSGKTSLKRFHSSFLISHNGYNLLVDAGDGVSKAILSQGISFSSINGILITHLHPDHYSGLASIIVQMKLTGRKKNLQIIVHKKLKKVVEDFIHYSYLFRERLDFDLVIETFEHNIIFQVSEHINFIGRQNSHLTKYKQYSSGKNLSYSCSSILFTIKNKKILYTGDIGKKEDLYIFEDNEPEIIISEITHVNIEDLEEAYNRFMPKKFYITHISDEIEHFLVQKKTSLDQQKLIPVVDGFTIKI